MPKNTSFLDETTAPRRSSKEVPFACNYPECSNTKSRLVLPPNRSVALIVEAKGRRHWFVKQCTECTASIFLLYGYGAWFSRHTFFKITRPANVLLQWQATFDHRLWLLASNEWVLCTATAIVWIKDAPAQSARRQPADLRHACISSSASERSAIYDCTRDCCFGTRRACY